MNNQTKSQSPQKARGKNLDYLEWCQRRAQPHERNIWIDTLKGIKFDYEACLEDKNLQLEIITSICRSLASRKNGQRYRSLLDDAMLSRRKIFSSMKFVLTNYCD